MGCVVSSCAGGTSTPSNGFRQQYVLGEKIGEGAFSVVRKATEKATGRAYAVKCFRKMKLSDQDVKDILLEVDLLRQMNHPHVLNLRAFFDEPEFYYTVMDLVEGGELFDRIVEKEYYTEKECRDLIKILLETIQYCHSLGIVHRDLKPDNILMTSRDDDASIKIADFGLAKQDAMENNLMSSCGTPEYIAPEIARNVFAKEKVPYGKAVDIWSIGVITYVLLCGYTPFHANNQVHLFRKILKGHVEFNSPYWDDISTDAKHFVARMLVVDPTKRATAAQLLQDPWVVGLDVSDAQLPGVIKRMTSRRRLKAAMATVHSTIALSKAIAKNPDEKAKAHALQKLHEVVDHFWAEIADAVPLIESLSEEEAFPHRELAASVASKCFFHLEEYHDALRLALGAGKYFDVNSSSPYTETIIATCIDEYIAIRTEVKPATMGPGLEAIVEQMFDRCYASGTYKQALGVALESRRLDKVEESLRKSPDVSNMLAYCFDVCRTMVTNRAFRLQVLEVLVTVYSSLPVQEHSNICLCLQLLDRYDDVAALLLRLVAPTAPLDDALVAYQVAFDLADNENQKFLAAVHSALPADDAGNDRLATLKKILLGDFTVDLLLDFMFRQSDADPLVMKQIKVAVENRNSVLHNAAVCSHALMHCGTTVDTFLRENLDWLGKASNWAKFTATASIGVIHKGHVRESMNLLAPYLPATPGVPSPTANPYSEGGALYALGLIHANKATPATLEYLRAALRNSGTDEVVQHGACLGLGLVGMATANADVYEELKNILFTDNAVAGEGAGLAIGLVHCGAGDSAAGGDMIKELLSYAHDTKHEKIIRGAVLGIALMMYGREEHAEAVIETLTRDKDPLVRYGGVYTIAMAYVGTANNAAVKRLLHIAVSDVSDDVRRAAVTCLGFVLFRTPAQVPKLVSLLAESFNPHVRYGACIAVGIACAGTFKNEAIQLLEPMLDDAVDYVRQGALFALAMVIMQESEGRSPKVKEITEKIRKLTSDKHVTTMTKMGAVLAQGLLDAGGRNVVISLQSHNGFTKMSSVVGLALWAQHWFWYPLHHVIELAFQPTVAIGLNKDLKMPSGFALTCNTKPSHFAYPKRLEEKKEEKKELVATAILSTTAKAKARLAKQEAKEEAKEAPQDKPDEEMAPVAKKVKEPSSFTLKNPARVTLSQEQHLAFDWSQRYVPVVASRRPAGIIVLKDRTPTEAEAVVAVQAPSAGNASAEEEADAPEPFEWEPPAAP
ncbi:26S proteasome non-ATPase regulatory subunit [Achlya hypogyna]|uniref:26S proteasome non-ATPase regulatory subunit n=1 Tax=Achlya hypogyna TaxID=1202772 RepID=A0A1V9YC68_ACHHY|nr:26S proteasome non-ATPase regulatory subunit [Achlya hypogyna]